MRLVIHAGASKTGTSAFQALMVEQFTGNREAGVLYPQSGRWLDGSHHELAFAIRPLPHLVSEQTPEVLLREMESEIRSAQPHTVVLSSELFPYLLEQNSFKEFATRNFSRVSLVFVVRRQSELLFSLYNQLVKDPIQAFTGTVLECFISNIQTLNYFEIIKRWQSSPLLTEILMPIYAQDYLPGMLKEIGIPANCIAVADANRLNKAFPVQWLETIRLANALLPSWRDRERLARCLSDLDVSSVSASTKLIYSGADQRTVDGFFEQGNRELARKYLGREDLFPAKTYLDIESWCNVPASSLAVLLASCIEYGTASDREG